MNANVSNQVMIDIIKMIRAIELKDWSVAKVICLLDIAN